MIWIIAILGSAFFFALNHIFRKKILESANVTDMMILTCSIGFLIMLPFLKFIDFNVSSRNLFLILLASAFAFGGSFLLNVAYKRCEISTVSPLLNMNPLFVILLSYFILGEVLNSKQFMGVLLILIGGYIITLEKIRYFLRPFTSMPKKYFLIVFSTLVLWTFCPVLNRIVLLEVDSITYLFFFTMFIFCIQIVLLISKNRFRAVIALAREKWPLLIITSLFMDTSDFLHLTAIAIPTAMVSLVMPVKRMSNLFTVILGGNLFKEKNLTVKSIACAIMLAGLFVIGLYS